MISRTWPARAHARVLPLVALLVLGGCLFHGKQPVTASAPASPAAAPGALQPLPSSAVLYYDNSGGIRDSVRLVVRDPQALAGLWQQATAGQPAPPPLPTIDFGREMVLAAGAGRMTPEDQIHVDSVGVRRQTGADGRQQDVLTAWLSVLQGCRRFQADAYPVEIVRVRRFDGPVRFVAQHVQPMGCK